MPTRLPTIVLTLALAAALSACGSSKAPGVSTAPAGGSTAATGSTTASSTTSTSAATNVTRPPQLAKEPVVKPPSGPPPKRLVIRDLITGTGKTATAGSTVTVNYVGVLYKGGQQFDASWKRHQTFTTALSQGGVITGWVQGIPGMKVGGRRELIVPPNLGYGAAGSPPTIPPNATLVFVVDLLAVS